MSNLSQDSNMSGISSLRFATLTPENKVARECLNSASKQLQQTPGASLNSVVVNDVPESAHRATLSKYRLELSFDDQEHGRDGAWVVGKFDPKSAATRPVDLPICSARSRQLKGLRFCEIFIHQQSGALVLRNINEFHPIVYLLADGNHDVALTCGDEHVLHQTDNHLRIGSLDFILNISVDDETAYCTSRNSYMQKWCQNWDPHCLVVNRLDPLPRATHVRIGDVMIHHSYSRGGFGVVRVGVHRRTGDAVACKTIHGHRRDTIKLNNEVDIASSIDPDTIGVVHLIGASCEHGCTPPCFQNTLEDVHLVMPFAPYSFQTVAWRTICIATKLAMFRQVLQGLVTLHAAEIMHRDISPNNLLVFSIQPPIAKICDFGKSKKGTTGDSTSLGPLVFTAPEPRRGVYSNAIDVFSMGISILATFQGVRWPGPLSEPANHARVLAHLASLQDSIPGDLVALLGSMLAWDPDERPTAEEALAHTIWQQVAADEAGSEPGTARETTSSGSSSSGPGPSSTDGTNGGHKRFRRSDAPSVSQMDRNKRARRSESADRGLRHNESRSHVTLLSPPLV